MSFSGSTLQANAILDVEVRHLASTKVSNPQTEFVDQVPLVVNTASKCVHTPIERTRRHFITAIHEKTFSPGIPIKRLCVSRPGTEAQIADVCYVNYGVTFPMFEKISVRGKDAHTFFRSLSAISVQTLSNFLQVLNISRRRAGYSVSSHTTPILPELVSAIEAALQSFFPTASAKPSKSSAILLGSDFFRTRCVHRFHTSSSR